MIFETFQSGWIFLMVSTMVISVAFGYTAKNTNFCTMGAVSDYVNFQDTGRLRAWILALAVGILFMGILEYKNLIDLSMSFPNYRQNNFIWAEYILGGLIFGVGMTYASGCGNKTLVRIGEGDINSLITATFIGIAAYYMINPMPFLNTTIFELAFYDWIRPLAQELTHEQDITSFLLASYPELDKNYGGENIRLALTSSIGIMLVYMVFKKKMEKRNIIAGVGIGVLVSVFWLVSNNTFINVDDESYLPHQYMEDWEMVHENPEDDEGNEIESAKPTNTGSFRPQSFTFVNPVGNTFAITRQATKNISNSKEDDYVSVLLLLNMGVMAVLGVTIGSFLSSLLTKTFKIKLNYNFGAVIRSILSGMAMGVGGILAIGCTIGQGVTGASTLSVGSILALLSIIIGSFITQKIIYWNLMRD